MATHARNPRAGSERRPAGRGASVRAVGVCLATLLSLALAWIEPSAAASTPSLYRYASPGAWVDPIQPDYAATVAEGDAVDGLWYLLIDRQFYVQRAGDDMYFHVATRLVNAEGVREKSQINLEVDPTYQSLSLHSLQVVRQGKVIDQRQTARITALPQETELRERIYNGRYNINVLLSDVRVGDVVEYAYTVHSQEKNFPGHFATSASIGWSVPVSRQRVRLLYPAERPMRMRVSDGRPLPSARQTGDMYEFVLESRDLAAITADQDRPSWYSPWPYLEVTDLPDWSAVARLVQPMYPMPEAVGPGVAAIVAKIREEGGTAQQQALRALQHVQEHISYTSISIGPGAYRPAAPEQVLQRSFGDCKDKALLLATILRELGLQADVALVHTDYGRVLDDALPTPYAFDHAIVRAEIGSQVYWLDGTAAKQYAELSTQAPADYERALPIHAPSAGLEAIPRPSSKSSAREVNVVLDLRKGLETPGTVEVTTRYRGRAADSMRASLSGGGREQRQADYVNYFAAYYPGLQVRKAYTVDDDKAANVLTLREYYVMPKPFRKNDDGELELTLHADELYRYADSLESSVRTAPLALTYPQHVTQVVTARLPEDWGVEPDSVTIENPAFRYHGTVEYAARTVTVKYEYEALKDEVAPKELARYLTDRKRFYDDIGYRLTKDEGGASAARPFSIAPVPLVAMLLALALGAWVGWRWLFRFDPEPAPVRPDAPSGIRGWLLVPALSAVATPLVLVFSVMIWGQFIGADVWHALPDRVAPAFRGTVHAALLLILASQALLMCWGIVLAILFFRKRSSVPRVFVTYLWAVTVTSVALQAYIGMAGLDDEYSLPKLMGESAGDVFFAVVWTAYFARSSRVAATFRGRLRPEAVTPPLPSEPSQQRLVQVPD